MGGCHRIANKGRQASVAFQRNLAPLQPRGIVAARVARPVLGIVDDAGEQAAGLLAVVGLRLRHQPFGVEAAGSRIGYGADKPKLKAFLQKIHARPAYQRALERGGPYSYA